MEPYIMNIIDPIECWHTLKSSYGAKINKNDLWSITSFHIFVWKKQHMWEFFAISTKITKSNG
jgi:hypothetical protein